MFIYEFSNYGGLSINLYQQDIDTNVNKEKLDDDIYRLINVASWTLVEWSHIKDGAWDKTYMGGLGNHQIIDNKLIKQDAGIL